MTQVSMARRRDRRIIRRFGNGLSAVLRQKNSLTADPHVWAGTTAGASSLIATAGEGTVVRGAVFSVQGVAGTYTVDADATTTADGKITLVFSPVLAGSAEDGVAITFSQPYGESTYPVMDGPGREEVDKEVEGGQQIRVVAYQAGKPAPRVADELDGLPITAVDPIGNPASRYRCTVTPP